MKDFELLQLQLYFSNWFWYQKMWHLKTRFYVWRNLLPSYRSTNVCILNRREVQRLAICSLVRSACRPFIRPSSPSFIINQITLRGQKKGRKQNTLLETTSDTTVTYVCVGAFAFFGSQHIHPSEVKATKIKNSTNQLVWLKWNWLERTRSYNLSFFG